MKDLRLNDKKLKTFNNNNEINGILTQSLIYWKMRYIGTFSYNIGLNFPNTVGGCLGLKVSMSIICSKFLMKNSCRFTSLNQFKSIRHSWRAPQSTFKLFLRCIFSKCISHIKYLFEFTYEVVCEINWIIVWVADGKSI